MMKRILVVDDDPPITKGIEMVLNNAGYSTTISLEGKHVIKLVHSFKPNLILLDAMIGDVDGRAIAKILKTNKDTRSIPIVLISAYQHMGEDIGSYGIASFISKPFSSSHLLKIVGTYCC